MSTDNPSPEQVAESLLMLAMQFQHKLIRPTEQMSRPKLSPMQFQALVMTSGHGPIGMGELASALAIPKQQLTPIIDRIEHLGFITRSSDPEDRRMVLISLSPEGKVFLESQRDLLVSMFVGKFSQLTTQDLSDLHLAIGEMVRVVSKLNP